MAIRRNSPETAEEYLRIIVQEGFAPAFAEQGYKLPAKIDIDFGFTSHGTRKGPVGEYYEGAATTNGVPKMNIRCDTADMDPNSQSRRPSMPSCRCGGGGRAWQEVPRCRAADAVRRQKHEGGRAGPGADDACTRSRRVPWTVPPWRPQIRDARSRRGSRNRRSSPPTALSGRKTVI